jgi:hypothetical protein
MSEAIDVNSIAETALENWGRWAAARSIDLSFPHQATFRRLLGSIVPEPTITDDEGRRIDRIVSGLRNADRVAHHVAAATWVYCLSLDGSAKALHMTIFDVRMKRQYVLAWVASAFRDG